MIPTPCAPRMGIIPAYAGSTCPRLFRACLGWGSSPHTRGAPRRAVYEVGEYIGSSPHTRGARFNPLDGKGCGKDHPRIRGEHDELEEWCDRTDGIIPAYAGSTVSL